MGEHLESIFAGGEDDLHTSSLRMLGQLIFGRAFVAPEGERAMLQLGLAGGVIARYAVSLEAMALLNDEVRTAAGVMLRRQRLGLDRGATALAALTNAALNPTRVDMVCDRRTGDWVFLHQFADHAPVALRLSRAQLANNLDVLHEALRSRMH